ncbi:hypothetical protein B0J14DRAFT_450001, partial [Halenospora varia]
MCFYDQYALSCGDFKWGNFRQHCSKEYRIGETCGMKLVMQTISRNELCKICRKIETKLQRVEKEVAHIRRWQLEELGTSDLATTKAIQDEIGSLEGELDHV